GVINTNYGPSWGTHSTIVGFANYSNDFAVLFRTTDTLKIYDSTFTGKTIDYVTYNATTYPALSAVVEELCIDAGLESGDVDVTDLASAAVIGYARGSVCSARRAIEPLQQSYLFDVAECEKKLKFVLRGGASAVTIPTSDLQAKVEQEVPDLLQAKYANQDELPSTLVLRFMHPDHDYEQSAQVYTVYFPQAVGIFELALPMVLTNTLSLQIAQKLLISARSANIEYKFFTTTKYIYLAPADVVTINGYRMRIVDMASSGMVLAFTARSEFDASVYESELETEENIYLPYVPQVSTTSYVEYLDIPILSSNDNDSGFYMAAFGIGSEWPGCILYYSLDGGAVWSPVVTAIYESMIGSTLNILASAGESTWDRSNTLTIQPYEGTLSSAAETAVLNGSNLVAVGAHGRWELMRFADATLNGDGTYTIQTFLRGLYGTEWAIGLHQTNDVFVVLDLNIIDRVPLGSNDINQERGYKAVTIGGYITAVTQTNFTNTAQGLKPYPVSHVRGVRASNNNITITWKRRDRIYGEVEWGDYASATTASDVNNYEIDIVDASPARTIEITGAQTATYTAAQQTTDGFSIGDPIDIKIYELSETAGRGNVKEVTLNLAEYDPHTPSASESASASPSESPSESASLSPSASESPSESASYSPSASESPSESASLSPSASESPSESPSESISESPSESVSLSPSASESPSESASLSSSA
ncbi:MAG: phage tail protein, partial [Planctomycetota bacterium]